MAFYARSEEARQSHSVHKLALVRIECMLFCHGFMLMSRHSAFLYHLLSLKCIKIVIL